MILIALLSIVVHGVLLWWGYQSDEPITPAQPQEMSIEFAAEAWPAPAPPPEPAPEPEPIEQPVQSPVREDAEAVAPLPKPAPVKAKPARPKPVPTQKRVEPTQSSAPAATPSAAPAPNPTHEPASLKETAAVSGVAGLGNPAPPYPQMALRRLWEGRVELRINVTAQGRAASVSVTRSSGHELLDDAAVETVRTWKFLPAKHGDTPVSGTATQVIDFKLPK
ncbi:energy transducer TonB [Pseudomonas sp. TH49]|nr:energy transducer TonB [Pseudomonas sp. TH49]